MNVKNLQREADIKAMLRQRLEQFAVKLRGHKVFLFGSRVTGKAKDRADFDLGVYGEKPLSIETFFAIEDALDDLPTLHRIDWVDFNRVEPKFRERAMQHIEILYE